MPQIILVSGPSNSGKTSSILKFLENRGIFYKPAGDIAIIVPLVKNGTTYQVGIASGGDTLEVVEANFKFFSLYPLDIIICASKSRGATLDYTKNTAAKYGLKFDIISTQRVASLAVLTAVNGVAIKIENKIP